MRRSCWRNEIQKHKGHKEDTEGHKGIDGIEITNAQELLTT